MSELKIGTQIKDRYTLKEFKGSGSFGEVWLAHDEVLDCDVAIKIYISLDPRGVEEFKSEYITTQGIYHPNLLTTTYFDVWEQRPFLVMKYCDKGSTTALAGQMTENELWHFIHDVAAGLKHLHSLPEPIIHQDIKPDNILIDDSNIYLITDFGISKKIRSTMRKLSKRAVGAGATAYMGPERFDSDPAPVKASDIWSLGASIYELATGQLPFNGMGGGMQKNGAEIPTLDQNWSKELTLVMQSCLSKEPWNRPTAEQLENYSYAILNGKTAEITWNLDSETIEDYSESNTEPTVPTDIDHNEPFNEKRSNKKLFWLILAFILILLIGVSIYFTLGNKIKTTDTQDVSSVATDIIVDPEKISADITEVDSTDLIDKPQEDSNASIQDPVPAQSPNKLTEETNIRSTDDNKDNSSSHQDWNQLITLGLEEANKELPQFIENGLIFTRVYLSGNYVVFVYECDEDVYSIETLKQNNSENRSNILNMIKVLSKSNPQQSIFMNTIANAGKGLTFMYIGDTTGDKAIMNISNTELKRIL